MKNNIYIFTATNSINKFSLVDGIYIDLYKELNKCCFSHNNMLVVTGGNTDGIMSAGTDLAIKNFFKNYNVDIEKDIKKYDLKLTEIISLKYSLNNFVNNFDITVLYVPTVLHPIYGSTYDTVKDSYKNIYTYLDNNKFEVAYIPMLGAGYGRLDFKKVEEIYFNIFCQ